MENGSDRLQEAYRYCAWITYGHYENFPVASWLLPKEQRPFIAAIYAFARAADDFADEEKYRGRSLALLEGWRSALRDCAGGRADPAHPIFIALSDAIRRRGLPVQLLDDLLTAFTWDVTKKRYSDWEELMTYCRHSANPVGRLVLTVFGIGDPELHRLSDNICSGLQLANHWQDLSIDLLGKDRLYVPLDILSRHGLDPEGLKRLAAVPPTPQLRALGEELVARTRAIFDAGEPLIGRVRGPLRLELKLTLLGGRAILDRIVSSGYDTMRSRPTLSAAAKARLLSRAVLG